MRASVPKKISKLGGAIALIVGLLITQVGLVFADSKPYFIANEGDIFAGGWFLQGSNCDTNKPNTGTYQAPDFGSLSTTRYRGAIMSFTDSNSRVGASSNIGAFSLGLIEGSNPIDPSPTPSRYGFYTGLSSTSALSFSNYDNYAQVYPNPFWGGLFNGGGAEVAHCIPDYWVKQSSAPAATPAGSFSLAAANGKYTLNAGASPFIIPGGTIAPGAPGSGRNLTYFIDGDVYINDDIVYGTPYNAENVPKFALVVRGNIYVAPGVDRLDGWYIAQPNGSNDGQVWTCHDGTTLNNSPLSDLWVRTNCGGALTINGALTARRVNLLRIAGGLGSVSPGTSAEVINYTPEMVIDGPFFNASSATTGGGIQSLISLPPVF